MILKFTAAKAAVKGVRKMADFKAMYFRLFVRVADAITVLQGAQQECEDIYSKSLPSGDFETRPNITLLKNEKKDD